MSNGGGHNRRAVRLVAKFLGQNDLLLALDILRLPLAILQGVVDASLLLTRILDTRSLLVLDLLLKLSDELDVACQKKVEINISACSPIIVAKFTEIANRQSSIRGTSFHLLSAAGSRNTLVVENAA